MSGRRHHFVSVFYLKRFADQRDQIAVYRRDPPKVFVTSVTNAAVEAGFYALTLKDGSRSEMAEELIAKIEDWAAPALGRILSGHFPPTSEDRQHLSLFMALQIVRGRHFRDQSIAMMDYHHKLMVVSLDREDVRQRLAEKKGQEPGDDEVEQVYASLQKTDEYFIRPGDDSELVVSMLKIASEDLAPRIYRKTWVLAHSRSKVFLTSDHPLVFWHQPKTERERFLGVGLENAGEVRFPLDAHHVLVLTNERVPEIAVQVDPGVVKDMNRLAAWRSYEQVFCDPRHIDLLKVLDLPRRQPVMNVVSGFPSLPKGDIYALPRARRK
jgi:uncharacterized protein DUF4238